jgi:hypothetical protein
MHISEFTEEDVLFSLHNYDKWARGQTQGATEDLLEAFPGETYGLHEDDFEHRQYGRENIDQPIETEDKSGQFSRNKLDIEHPDYVVLAGGNIGECHWQVYDILQKELESDTEFVFPPETCFGYTNLSSPQPGYHTLEQLQTGELESDFPDYFIDQMASEEGFDKYDWGKCSIQNIES